MADQPIKLYYFNAPILGEPVRFILHYGGLKFTDQRVGFLEFRKMKEDTEKFPMGKMPVLEIEGRTLHQSMTICRFLARRLGLVGKTEWEEVQCDVTADAIVDLRSAMGDYFTESSAKAKRDKKEVLFSTTLPFILDKFETQVSENGGHFVGGQVTWVDLYFCSLLDYFKFMVGKDLLKNKPNLKALNKKVLALPGIKEYIARRPKPFPCHITALIKTIIFFRSL